MEEAARWNETIIAAGGSFLQSFEWGMLQERLGNSTRRFWGNQSHAFVIERSLPFYRSYLYAPRGPIFKNHVISTDALNAFIASLKEMNSSRQPIFLRIEPELNNTPHFIGTLTSLGFREIDGSQPKETILLDLTLTEEKLLQEMEHGTRYAIRTAEKRGVRVTRARTPLEKETAFEVFWNIFAETNKRRGLAMYTRVYYEMVAYLSGACASEIFIASINAAPIATALIVRFGDRATYLFAGSREGFGRFNAPTLILWETIRAAKKERCRVFDLWGISRDNLKWRGITAFKKTFGGKRTSYLGTWDLPFDKLQYNMYRTMARIMR